MLKAADSVTAKICLTAFVAYCGTVLAITFALVGLHLLQPVPEFHEQLWLHVVMGLMLGVVPSLALLVFDLALGRLTSWWGMQDDLSFVATMSFCLAVLLPTGCLPYLNSVPSAGQVVIGAGAILFMASCIQAYALNRLEDRLRQQFPDAFYDPWY